MGLLIRLEKQDDAPDRCVYTFGASGHSVGRAVLHKDSGDVELLTLDAPTEGPNERYVLAQVVPRLHDYHDREAYPDADQWTA